MLPTKISELKDFFVNFGENEKIPGWVIEMLDILLEYEDQADTNTGPYREFKRTVVKRITLIFPVFSPDS